MDAPRWQRVRAEFDELVELEASQQKSRLAAIGDSDPELRRAVESLLAADGAADRQLSHIESRLLRRAASSLHATAAPVPDPLGDRCGLVGRVISHFRVLELLETGGMGVVYKAEDLRLNRCVALKFLLPQYHLDRPAKARFLEEARAIAALDHPNL
jgi:serine/threonine protein kinase